jgi:hypothetical protein
MTYSGQVKDGVVVLDRRVKLADGTRVRVQPVARKAATKKAASGKAAKGGQTLGQRLMKFAGTVKGLPRDMARNHDHYIHGTPRK